MAEGYDINCPNCGVKYHLVERGKYQCLDCGKVFYCPENLTVICPYCHSEIPASAPKCRYCGEWIDKNAQNYEKRPTYLLLSFLFGNFGVGEFYAGRNFIGFVYLAFTFVFAFCFPEACIAIWLISFIGALLSDFGLPPEKTNIHKAIRTILLELFIAGLITLVIIAISR